MKFRIQIYRDLPILRNPKLETAYVKGAIAASEKKGLKEVNPYKRSDLKSTFELGWLDVEQGATEVTQYPEDVV